MTLEKIFRSCYVRNDVKSLSKSLQLRLLSMLCDAYIFGQFNLYYFFDIPKYNLKNIIEISKITLFEINFRLLPYCKGLSSTNR